MTSRELLRRNTRGVPSGVQGRVRHEPEIYRNTTVAAKLLPYTQPKDNLPQPRRMPCIVRRAARRALGRRERKRALVPGCRNSGRYMNSSVTRARTPVRRISLSIAAMRTHCKGDKHGESA
eukprot:6197648-Pleurochrysis_carterae.AAC.1